MFNAVALTGVVDSSIVAEIGTLLTTVTGWITSNPVLLIFFTVSLAGIGVGFFKRLKRAI